VTRPVAIERWLASRSGRRGFKIAADGVSRLQERGKGNGTGRIVLAASNGRFPRSGGSRFRAWPLSRRDIGVDLPLLHRSKVGVRAMADVLR
jgi:hypothetical protein